MQFLLYAGLTLGIVSLILLGVTFFKIPPHWLRWLVDVASWMPITAVVIVVVGILGEIWRLLS